MCRDVVLQVRNKRCRSNIAVIIDRIVFISSFLFYCLLLNHSFPTNPNRITNCFKLFSLFTTYNYIAPASLFWFFKQVMSNQLTIIMVNLTMIIVILLRRRIHNRPLAPPATVKTLKTMQPLQKWVAMNWFKAQMLADVFVVSIQSEESEHRVMEAL